VSASADRLTAVRLLVRVEGGAFASRLLERVRSPGVRVRVMGVLRWLRPLDVVLQPKCRRPLGRLDPEVRAVLRSALFEARFLGVPAPVATDQAVRTVRRVGKSSAAGLVNAVVRRAVHDWTEVLADQGLDVHLSHPKWLLDRWRDLFGEERAEAMARADQEPAPLWVWFSEGTPGAVLSRAGSALRPHPWCPGAWTAPGAGPELADAVSRGDAHAQDPASQLVAHLAVSLAGGLERPILADLCAAPGGKTRLMAARRRWAEHVAVEVHPRRARRLSVAVARSRAAVLAVRGDAGSPPLRPGAWDVVLLDAPCSGTGTIRRHPELRWRLGPGDLPVMARRQQRLIRSALDLLAADGVLLYATCSVEPEENEDLLGNLPSGFEPRRLEPHLPSLVPVLSTAAGGVRILQNAHSDGFSIHAIGRRGLQSRS
jgi:16S rRNA (cytosine967-C5)-methyltransferase